MPKPYDLAQIKAIYDEAFTDKELRCLCYDVLEFKPVYDQLTEDTSRRQIIDQLISFGHPGQLIENFTNKNEINDRIQNDAYQQNHTTSPNAPPNQFADLEQSQERKIMQILASNAVRFVVAIIGVTASLVTIFSSCFSSSPEDLVIIVVDSIDKQPISQIEVRLDIEGSSSIFRTITDNSGIARFNNIITDERLSARISINHPQYNKYDGNVTIDRNNLRFEVRLPLNPVASQQNNELPPTNTP